MNTSTTIKQRQYNPIQGTRKGNRWTFPSESRDRVSYTVERNGAAYKCGCPATGLCKHITSAVLDDAKAKFDIVQVWTSEQDADRQHRRKLQMTANGKPFWVTYEQRNLLKGVVQFCGTWGGGGVDLHMADGTKKLNQAINYNELVALAERRGWQTRGMYHVEPETYRREMDDDPTGEKASARWEQWLREHGRASMSKQEKRDQALPVSHSYGRSKLFKS